MSVITCDKCGSTKVKRKLINITEAGNIKYFDVALECEACGYEKVLKVEKKSLIPKERDEAKSLAKGLKLREYLPEEKVEESMQFAYARETGAKLGEMLISSLKDILIFIFAIGVGLGVEIANIRLHNYLIAIQVDPFVGFILQLVFFVFGPIAIAGYIIYKVSKDLPKALFYSALAIPITIILLAKIGVT